MGTGSLELKLCHELRGHTREVVWMEWSPDGSQLASCSIDRSVRIWDMQSGVLLQVLTGHGNHVYHTQWSADGKALASASADKTIRVWDVGKGIADTVLTGHIGGVSSIAWLPDGKTLVSCAPGEHAIYRWNIVQKELLEQFKDVGLCGSTYGADILTDGRRVLSGGRKKADIRLWDLETKQLHKIFSGHSDTVYAIARTKDDRTLFSTSADQTVRVWDLHSGKALRVLSGHSSGVIAVTLCPVAGMPILATKSRDNTVRLWDQDGGPPIAVLDEPCAESFWICGIAFHPTVPLLATLGEADRIIRIWEVRPSGTSASPPRSAPVTVETPQPLGIPQNLRERLRSGQVIPFVGAGVSMSVLEKGSRKGLFPSWKALLEAAAERLDGENAQGDAMVVRGMLTKRQPDFLAAARYAREGLGPLWFQFLKENLAPLYGRVDESSLELAQVLWRLGPLLVTTNYDNVLRWACPPTALHDLKVWDIQAPPEMQAHLAAPRSHPVVWHLHGHIDNAERIILTPDGYHQLYSVGDPEGIQYKAALQMLRQLLASKTFLFVGFSFDDSIFAKEVRWVQDVFAQAPGPHYILARKSETSRLRERVRGLPVEVLEVADFGPPLLAAIQELAGHLTAGRDS